MLNFFQNLYQNIPIFLEIILVSPFYLRELEKQYTLVLFDAIFKVIDNVNTFSIGILNRSEFFRTELKITYEVMLLILTLLVPLFVISYSAYKYKKRRIFLTLIPIISIMYSCLDIIPMNNFNPFDILFMSFLRIFTFSSTYGLFLILKKLLFRKNESEINHMSEDVKDVKSDVEKKNFFSKATGILYRFLKSKNIKTFFVFVLLTFFISNREYLYSIKPVQTSLYMNMRTTYIDNSNILYSYHDSNNRFVINSYDKYNFEKKWTQYIEDEIPYNASVFITENGIIVINSDNDIIILSKNNGEIISTIDLKFDDSLKAKKIINTNISLSNKLIVFEFTIYRDNINDPNLWEVYYFDIESGERVLKTDGFTKIIYSDNQYAYFYKREYQQDVFYKLHLETKEVTILNKKPEMKYLGNNFVATYNNQMLFISNDLGLYLLDENGEFIWKITDQYYIYNAETQKNKNKSYYIKDNYLFIMNGSNRFHKINLNNGDIEKSIDINKGFVIEILADKYLLVFQYDRFNEDASLISSKNTYIDVYNLNDLTHVKELIFHNDFRMYDDCYRHTYISPNNELIFDCDSYFMRKFDLNFMLNDSFGKPWFFRIFD